MLQNSIEKEQAQAEGYPAFMSAEHICAVLRRGERERPENIKKNAFQQSEAIRLGDIA